MQSRRRGVGVAAGPRAWAMGVASVSAVILDGRAAASDLRNEISSAVAAFTTQHGPISVAAILIGDDEAGLIYAENQSKRSLQAGVQHRVIQLPLATTQAELHRVIDELNADASVTGVMLQMPLPDHLDAGAAQYRIDPYKDVECVNPANIGWLFYGSPITAPCTALAVVELVRRSGLAVRGAEAVVVGQSRVVGRPISMFLTTQMATVTSCHIATRDVTLHTRRADLLVVAVGKPHIVGAEHVKPGAVVIDVGINKVDVINENAVRSRRTVGDVDFDAVAPVAGAITPVPGGVGPLTVMMLLRNAVECAKKQQARRSAAR